MLLDLTEHERLVPAVREAARRQTFALVATVGGAGAATACPRCGDRVIVLDIPMTYSLESGLVICRACRAERDLDDIAFPDADLGGEGA